MRTEIFLRPRIEKEVKKIVGKNNYLVLTIPNEYRNYYHYMYGHCGKANILLPCNYVDGELRFYITSSITKTPGR